jgi:hypothetical protein
MQSKIIQTFLTFEQTLFEELVLSSFRRLISQILIIHTKDCNDMKSIEYELKHGQ